MRIAVGEYSATEYAVRVYEDGHILSEYIAGNSGWDSQVYLSADEGVGLNEMRRYCESTTREIADEEGAEYGGIEEAETDDEDDW